MNKNDLYDALTGIEEKYTAHANDLNGIKKSFQHKKVRKIGIISSFCGCTVITGLAILLSGNSQFMPKPPNEMLTSSHDTIINHPEKTNITKSPSPCTTQYNLQTKNTTSQSAIANEKTTQTASTQPDTTEQQPPFIAVSTSNTDKKDSDSDSIPELKNMALPLETWLSDPKVVWNPDPQKGDTPTSCITETEILGSGMISQSLNLLMADRPLDSVYAIKVDFSPSIDENELYNWNFYGTTITELESQRNSLIEYTDDTSACTDNSENVHTTSTNKDAIAELSREIDAIKLAYYQMKIESFSDTFKLANLGIYPINSQSPATYFYTFATREHLCEFTCKPSEGFIFYPAEEIK